MNTRSRNFDALRLYFAVFVIFSHSFSFHYDQSEPFEVLTGGQSELAKIGLIGFFAISGYLVSGSWLSTVSFATYMRKRCLRIWPAFLVCAAICLFVVGPLSTNSRLYWRDLDLPWQLWGVATLHVRSVIPHVFDRLHVHALDGPTWSLPVEFAEYLLVALAGTLGAFRRRGAVVAAWGGLWGLCAFMFWVRPSWHHNMIPLQGGADHVLPLGMSFWAGVLVRLYPALAAPRTAAMAATIWVLSYVIGAGDWASYWAAPFVILWLGTARTVRLPITGTVDLSYGLYLSHCPVMGLIMLYTGAGSWATFALTMAVCVPIAAASWFLIERPALSLKSQVRSLRPTAPLVSTPPPASPLRTTEEPA